MASWEAGVCCEALPSAWALLQSCLFQSEKTFLFGTNRLRQKCWNTHKSEGEEDDGVHTKTEFSDRSKELIVTAHHTIFKQNYGDPGEILENYGNKKLLPFRLGEVSGGQ